MKKTSRNTCYRCGLENHGGMCKYPSTSFPYKIIAIHLGDNDFHSTFRNLLYSLYQVILYRDSITKEEIELCIREGIRYHYIAFQMRNDEDPKHTEYLINDYFKDITILFDDEAIIYLNEKGQDSGSWFLEVQTGNVYYW